MKEHVIDAIIILIIIGVVALVGFTIIMVVDKFDDNPPSQEDAPYKVFADDEVYYIENYIKDGDCIISTEYWTHGARGWNEWEKSDGDELKICGTFHIKER